MTQSAFAKFRQQAAAPAVRPVAQPGPVGVAPAPAQAYAPPAVAGANKYSGVKAAAGRHPQPQPGRYLFKVLKTYETTNPGKARQTYHADLEVVESMPANGQLMNPPGSTVGFLQVVNGSSATMGPPRVKAFVMAATGFETEEDYDQMDPLGNFINATAGARGGTYPDGSPIVDNPLGGVYVACEVAAGNPVVKNGQPTGEYYMQYSWAPAQAPDQTA